MGRCSVIDPALASVTKTAQLVRDRQISASEVVTSALSRIERGDTVLQAWETVDREGVLKQAQLADEAIDRGDLLGPLHGVPVGIKDIFATAGVRTSMGSPIYRESVPTQDAAVVSRLRGAGAIILGKTVTVEFAMGDPPRTLNPWNRDHTPGGSSSGSAVAVASGHCPAALGTQTAGSVIRPAAYNGVTGFKPTYGLVSRRGVFPVSWTLDTVGWLTRTVTDAAVLMDVLSGFDPTDPASLPSAGHGNVAAILTDGAFGAEQGPKLGIISGDIERSTSTEMQAHMFEVIELLRQGGNWVELFDLPISYLYIRDAKLAIDSVETAEVHRQVFSERPGDYGPSSRAKIETGDLVPATAYVQAQRLRRQFRRDMDEGMSSLDALIMPAAAGPAPRDLTTTGDPAFYSPWTTGGLPSITVPTGMSRSGLPLGVQLIGKGHDDAGLLRAARWVEERVAYSPQLPPLARIE
jgi:Asp-tRNA(Asn)/Glu-tRNA(Gln) amidotransferase A subunit family amidase